MGLKTLVIILEVTSIFQLAAIAQCNDFDSVLLEKAQRIECKLNNKYTNLWSKKVVQIVKLDERREHPLKGNLRTYGGDNYVERYSKLPDGFFSIWHTLFDRALQGEVQCLNSVDNKELSRSDILEIIEVDTVNFYNAQTKQLDSTKIYLNLYPRLDYIVIELWTMSKDMKISTNVCAVGPIVSCHNEETGAYMGRRLLCWFVLPH